VETKRKVLFYGPFENRYNHSDRGGNNCDLVYKNEHRDDDNSLDDSPDAPSPPSRRVSKWPMFQYHPYHDLESLYWVTIWFILNHFIAPVPEVQDSTIDITHQRTKAHLDQWRVLSAKLFNAQNFMWKRELLEIPDELELTIAYLCQWGWSEEALAALKEVLQFRGNLIDEYRDLQSQPQTSVEGRPELKRWGREMFTPCSYRALRSAFEKARNRIVKLKGGGKLFQLTPVRTLIKEQKAAERENAAAEREKREEEKRSRKNRSRVH
jgi:hypothetical protein